MGRQSGIDQKIFSIFLIILGGQVYSIVEEAQIHSSIKGICSLPFQFRITYRWDNRSRCRIFIIEWIVIICPSGRKSHLRKISVFSDTIITGRPIAQVKRPFAKPWSDIVLDKILIWESPPNGSWIELAPPIVTCKFWRTVRTHRKRQIVFSVIVVIRPKNKRLYCPFCQLLGHDFLRQPFIKCLYSSPFWCNRNLCSFCFEDIRNIFLLSTTDSYGKVMNIIELFVEVQSVLIQDIVSSCYSSRTVNSVISSWKCTSGFCLGIIEYISLGFSTRIRNRSSKFQTFENIPIEHGTGS